MRSKSRIIEGNLRRSPRKLTASTSRALPILLSQNEKNNGKSNDPKETIFETYSDSGENGDNVGTGVAVVEAEANSSPPVRNNGDDRVDPGKLGLRICIKCDVEDELVLVCGEIGCSIAVHQRCMGCEASFDGLGKFRCPVCEQKRAVSRVEEARRKVMDAKRALVRFLNGNFGENVGSDKHGVQNVEEKGKEDLGENREMGLGSNEGAEKRVNEENEGMELEASNSNGFSESEGSSKDTKEMGEAKTVVKCSKRFKQMARKRVNLRDKSVAHGTASGMKARKAIAKKNASNSSKIESFPRSKRKRLQWSSEEEQMLREGVQEISRQGNKNMSWKSILEFGRHVFDPTRTPDDLKDKWRNMTAKHT